MSTSVVETKKKVGRPSKLTPEALGKLEEAYLNHATDAQACYLAGISAQTLYDYQTKHPEFRIRKQALKGNLAYQAKLSLKKHIPRDGDLALKTLERLEKDEFSLRTEHISDTHISFEFIQPKQIEGTIVNTPENIDDSELVAQ